MSESKRVPVAQHDTYPGVPRWVKLFGIFFAAVAALVAVLHLSGHAPGASLHGSSVEANGHSEGESRQP